MTDNHFNEEDRAEEGDFKAMSVAELEEKIAELENSFAEHLAFFESSKKLKLIWILIQELREELQAKKSASPAKV